MMAAWLVVIEHRLHIHLTREKTRRPSTGLSPGERHEITDAPPERSCHDSAIPRARSSRWHSARSSGAMDARSRRLSSCPGFRPLGCTPDTATARRNCPPTCLARRARLHVGSCRIFPLNTAANPAPAHCTQATLQGQSRQPSMRLHIRLVELVAGSVAEAPFLPGEPWPADSDRAQERALASLHWRR
jgi:hypothetical protein